MKNVLLIIFLLATFSCHSQTNLNKETGLGRTKSIWQNSEDNYIYQVYFDNQYLEITDYTSSSYPKGGITLSKRKFGFYDSCDLPHVDSLQSSGTYYFEIDEDEINDDGSIEAYDCLELSFSREGEEEYMSIYRSSQQQFSTYKRLKKLPENLEEYLEKEHPVIYREYSNTKTTKAG